MDALVEGSVIREHNRMQVTHLPIRAATDEHLWSESYDRELGDVLALESDVAESIVQKIDISVSGQERSSGRDCAPYLSRGLRKLLCEGSLPLNKGTRPGVEEGVHYFEQALNADPNFGPAYVAQAEAYLTLGQIFVGAPPH